MSKNSNGIVSQSLKATIFSVITTLVGVLIFALILRFTTLSTSVVKPVNQFIKILSIFLGCFYCVYGNKGILKGLAVGIFFSLCINLLFALFSGDNIAIGSLALETLFCAIIGVICGVITVNLKNK